MISGAASSFASLANRRGPRQFVKFCIVGASSTIIDFAIFNVLLRFGLPPAVALSISFVGGVTNGFIWNSRWTFKEAQRDTKTQAPKFLATNVVGWLLNLMVTTIALVIAAHLHLTRTHHTPAETLHLVLFRAATNEQGFSALALNAAKLCATVVVTAWNFTASKFITFKAYIEKSSVRVPPVGVAPGKTIFR